MPHACGARATYMQVKTALHSVSNSAGYQQVLEYQVQVNVQSMSLT